MSIDIERSVRISARDVGGWRVDCLNCLQDIGFYRHAIDAVSARERHWKRCNPASATERAEIARVRIDAMEKRWIEAEERVAVLARDLHVSEDGRIGAEAECLNWKNAYHRLLAFHTMQGIGMGLTPSSPGPARCFRWAENEDDAS